MKIKRIIATISALLALLTLFAGCGEEDVDWITGETIGSGSAATTTTAPSAVSSAEVSDRLESQPSPVFKPGGYKMTNSTTAITSYLTDAGAVYSSYSSISRYVYNIDMSANASGFTLRFTFDSIYLADDDGSGENVVLDSASRDYLSVYTEPYYDIIGKTFTVSADARCNVTGISGVDEIIAECPNSANLLDKDNLLGVAQAFIYPIPDAFGEGTAWTLKQYGVSYTYSLSRLSRGKFEIVLGGEAQQPEAYTTDDGYTVSYTKVEPLSGTLYMSAENRALQEISSLQKSAGTISGSDGATAFCYDVYSFSTVVGG